MKSYKIKERCQSNNLSAAINLSFKLVSEMHNFQKDRIKNMLVIIKACWNFKWRNQLQIYKNAAYNMLYQSCKQY